MKKILCYLGIIVLLCLTFLPLALRKFYKDEVKEDENEIISNVMLSCKNDYFEVINNYQDDSIKMIVLKRIKTEEEKLSELDTIFDSIKTESKLTYNETDIFETIAIDFSVYTFDELNISNLTKTSTVQQLYYENQGLTCLVK